MRKTDGTQKQGRMIECMQMLGSDYASMEYLENVEGNNSESVDLVWCGHVLG